MNRFLLSIVLVAVFSTPGYTAGEPVLTEGQNTALEKITRDLEVAIKKRDFTALKSDIPQVVHTLHWESCENEAEEGSLDEIAGYLREASAGTSVLYVNPYAEPDDELGYTALVETKGWFDGNKYVYFEFSTQLRKWYGAACSEKRHWLFVMRQGKELPKSEVRRMPETIADLNKAIQTGNFEPMRKYIPSGKFYYWGICGPTDMEPGEYRFADLNNVLKKDLEGAKVEILQAPKVEKYGSSIMAFIETGKWKGDYPYLGFVFEFVSSENVWAWTRVYDCRQAPGDRYWEDYERSG